jgi:GNAT superfamily N-acetyltransferase
MDALDGANLTVQGVTLRLLTPADNVAELTDLLHRAYGALAARGMKYLASHQDQEVTRRRISRGECWLAEADGQIIATVTLRDAAHTKGSPWYDRPEVASFGQFAVDPLWQGRGVGSMLMRWVEERAREKGVVELAADTAEHAEDLIRFYTKRGYRFIEHVRWDVVNYRSVILSKTLSAPRES